MKKKNASNVILILVFLVGLSLLLYPSISDYWNTLHQTRAITGYAENVADLNDEQYDQMRRDADAFNQELIERSNDFYLSSSQKKRYEELLNVSGNGVIGFVEIPTINCTLPVYHGTKDSVLQIAVGHLGHLRRYSKCPSRCTPFDREPSAAHHRKYPLRLACHRHRHRSTPVGRALADRHHRRCSPLRRPRHPLCGCTLPF